MFQKYLFLKICLCVTLLSVFVAAGCSNKKAPTGTVSGTVKYKGEPVTVGTIMFMDPATKLGGSAWLGADGSYTITASIEVGEYNVAFPPPPAPPPGSGAERILSPLPSKYYVPEKGTVKFTVVAGKNTADFDLE